VHINNGENHSRAAIHVRNLVGLCFGPVTPDITTLDPVIFVIMQRKLAYAYPANYLRINELLNYQNW